MQAAEGTNVIYQTEVGLFCRGTFQLEFSVWKIHSKPISIVLEIFVLKEIFKPESHVWYRQQWFIVPQVEFVLRMSPVSNWFTTEPLFSQK